MSDDLTKFLQQSHEEFTYFDFEGKSIPCIVLEEKKYDEIFSKVAGKPFVINTNFNILQDGLGHVFVEIILDFSVGGIVEKILVNAGKDLLFFKTLAKSSILALSSPKSFYGKDNVTMNHLPQPEKAQKALEIIEKGLRQIKN